MMQKSLGREFQQEKEEIRGKESCEASKATVVPEIAVVTVQPPAELPKMYEGLAESIVGGNVDGNMKMRKRIKTDTNINSEVQIMDEVKTKKRRKRIENEGKNEVDGQTVDKDNSIQNLLSSKVSLVGKFGCKVAKNESAGENDKFESGLHYLNNDNITVYGAKQVCSSDGKDAEHLSEHLNQCPRMAVAPGFRRKLLVLDVNGLLAYIVMPPPKDRVEDARLLGRAIFKRPYCDDFLKFCFRNFDVGIWSSRSKKIIDKIVDYLLGDQKDKLLFCWDMSHSTQTGFQTLENIHKPLVFKELRNIWENDDPNIPWKRGDYTESNTLLLDDSPYKALLNPLNSAIFPHPYNYNDQDDKSLGHGGDIRVYLEALLKSENVRDYVKNHPFGQSVINESSPSWEFYSGILQALSSRLEDNNPRPINFA